MKQTITIRLHGDKVFILNPSGFQEGIVKTTIVLSEKSDPLNIKYLIKCKGDDDIYRGDEKKPHEVFDSRKEMIEYYSNLKL